MEINRAAIKGNAKYAMAQAKPNVMLVSLVFILITSVLSILYSSVVNLFYTDVPWQDLLFEVVTKERLYYIITRLLKDISPLAAVLGFALSIMSRVIIAGYTFYTLNVSRLLPAGYGNLFDGFNIFIRVLVLEFLVGFFVFAWSLLLVIPGIIATFKYSQSLYLFFDNLYSYLYFDSLYSYWYFNSQLLTNVFIIFMWSLLLMISNIIVSYRYRLTLYLAFDNPEMSPLACITASKDLMKGRKWEFFVLELSFMGWMFLCSIPSSILMPFTTSNVLVTTVLANIAYIWLNPYRSVTIANFYNALISLRNNPDGQIL